MEDGKGQASPPGGAATAVDWRRNLLVLWIAQFAAILGFAFAFPFLPIYIQQLGVRDPRQVALWVGAAGGATGIALAISSPIWGLLADRFGRKSMVIRAMVGGGLTVGLIALARGPLDLVLLRLLQGLFAGTVAATTTLVATGTPRERVGWAMGLMSSAIALGGAIGPLAGSVVASYFGLRATFVAGGALLLVAVFPVIFAVHEAPIQRVVGKREPAMRVLRQAGAGTLFAVTVLLAVQCLGQISQSGMQQLVALKLLSLTSGNGSTAAVGVAFACAGVASALAAIFYSRLVPLAGYRGVLIGAALLSMLALIGMGWTNAVIGVIVTTFLGGLFFGALGPATSAMIGLEAPPEVQGRVFGISASATAIGFAVGPLGGGALAGLVNVPVALYVMAAISGILSGLMAISGREPKR